MLNRFDAVKSPIGWKEITFIDSIDFNVFKILNTHCRNNKSILFESYDLQWVSMGFFWKKFNVSGQTNININKV